MDGILRLRIRILLVRGSLVIEGDDKISFLEVAYDFIFFFLFCGVF